MAIFGEFKQFVMRGNVIDLAVGLVVGAAFGKIVTSFVNDVLMPPVGMLLGGVDFSKYKIILKEAVVSPAGKEVSPETAIGYGVFINNVVDFIIVALAIFLMIKAINALYRKPAEAAPAPTKDQELLGEIRDLLASKPVR